MDEVTVEELAKVTGVTVDKMLGHFKEAGLTVPGAGQVITPEERRAILAHVRKIHGPKGGVRKVAQLASTRIIFQSIELFKVKSFSGRFTANFSNETRLFTVSGANGSGKSTVLRSLLLVQKAFFADQFEHVPVAYEKYSKLFDEEIFRYLKSVDSTVTVVLSLNDKNCRVKLHRTSRLQRGWDIECEGKELLRKVWNLKKPTSIVLYLDAGKSVLEEEVRYTSLNINDTSPVDLAVRCIFTPQHAFSEMYKQTIQDYILERLVPSSPPRTTYQKTTHDVFGKLLGTIGIANFSSRIDHQVALLARRVKPSKTSTFDIRELSSGEKTLYFTLSYLFLADTVGTLIIDEPENHFHEHLLLKLVAFLGEVVSAKSLADFLVAYLLNEDAKENGKAEEYWKKIYANHRLTQVFLLTHSKSLIYHAFSVGRNYAITHAGKHQEWSELAENSAERMLREVGLSTTLSRILFVEGQSDQAFLELAMAPYNVQIRPLNGSGAVKEMFKRLSQVRKDVKGVIFGFLIDSDDKPAEFVADLRKENKEFFDESFVVLDRHEIENYLLDADLFHEVVEHVRTQFNLVGNGVEWPHNLQSVKAEIVRIATDSLKSSYKKAVNAQVELGVASLLAPRIWGNKRLSYEDGVALPGMVEGLLGKDLHREVRNIVVEKAEGLRGRYFGISDDEAIARCDGKRALSMLTDSYARVCKIHKDMFLTSLHTAALQATKGPVAEVLGRLKTVFSEETKGARDNSR